jgi:very-short-patch-repair endonuclease
LHRGVYTVGHRKLTQEGRWMAAVLAYGEEAVLSHCSAGQLWGIVPRSGSIPDVTRGASSRGRPGIRAHRSSLPADEVERADGIPVTSVSRTLLDLAAILSRRQLERAMNEAEVRGLTSTLSLPDLIKRHGGRAGVTAIRSVLEAHGESLGVTRNDFEERFLALIDEHGLPRPRLNADLVLRGRAFEVDCLWRPQRLVVELDGWAAHGTRRAFHRDRERDRVLLVEGWQSTRVTWHQLEQEAEVVVADLRLLLDTAYP